MAYIICVIVTIAAALALSRQFSENQLLASLVIGTFIWCFGALIPAAFGVLNVATVVGATLLLGVGALFLAKRVVAPPSQRIQVPYRSWDIAVLAVTIVVAVIGIFNEPRFNSSFVKYLLLVVRYLFDDNSYPFDWDAVSYHLPAIIEFLQKRTAWSFDGPYQSYCFGFEFLAALPLMEFHSTFGFILGNLLATALIIVSSVCLVRMLTKATGCEDLSTFSSCAVFLMSYLLVEDRVWNFGKNDHFITGAILAALVFSIQSVMTVRGNLRFATAPILLSLLAMALAVASKPHMLGFVPAYGATLAYTVMINHREWKETRSWLLKMIPVAILVGCAGGFFLIRNLIHFGALSDFNFPRSQTLLFNLSVQTFSLLVQSGRFLLVVLGIMALIAMIVRTQGSSRAVLVIVLGWLLSGFVTFMATPYSLPDWGERESLQWRYGQVASLLSGIAVICCSSMVWFAFLRRWRSKMPHHEYKLRQRFSAPRWTSLACACIVAVLMIAPAVLGRHGIKGLRGYELIKGQPTEIYQWVQNQPTGIRIYAAGLRPAGLYGTDFSNQLFYDLHSSDLSEDRAGRDRLATVRASFHPDLIIISADPHPYIESVSIPQNEWLVRQPCVTRVYQDAVVSAFKVERGCTTPWSDTQSLTRPLRMGG
jgi:hypothetical protein